MNSDLRELIEAGSVSAVVAWLDEAPADAQAYVWKVGAEKLVTAHSRKLNKRMEALASRVWQGQLTLIWEEELDVAEEWAHRELRRTKSRIDGDTDRMDKLLGLVSLIAEARQAGAGTLAEYRPTGTDG